MAFRLRRMVLINLGTNRHVLDRLELLLLPETEWLMTNAKTPRGRYLYATQLQQYGALLDGHTGYQIQGAWALMRSLVSGVAQERMRDAPRVER